MARFIFCFISEPHPNQGCFVIVIKNIQPLEKSVGSNDVQEAVLFQVFNRFSAKPTTTFYFTLGESRCG
jgi:hypothetical protein